MSLEIVKEEIKNACAKYNREVSNVKLIAVSKFKPIEDIEEAIKQGQTVFGENRIQEAKEKFSTLKEKYPEIELHFIGHLQTNKAADAVAIADCIHSIDSIKLADALASEMNKQGRDIDCFIQVNTGYEEQKGGVTVGEDLEKLYKHCVEELKLNIIGLMCIPPVDDVADIHFALMHKIAGEMDIKYLSMGMSADFDAAIKFGATHIRVGSAIFGDRS